MTPNITNEDSLQAARRLCVVYAQNGEPGFGPITDIMQLKSVTSRDNADNPDLVPWDVMCRLFLTADVNKVPRAARNAASCAGGVAPGTGTTGWKECPNVGDAGNHAYAMLCNHLKGVYRTWGSTDPRGSIPGHLVEGMEYFLSMEKETKLASLVKAALGAADANLALEEFRTGKTESWNRRWEDMKGAGRAEGDYVTTFIEDWLKAFHHRG